MGRRMRLLITSGCLLLMSWAAGQIYAEDSPPGPTPPAVTFEDKEAATLNPKVDAAASKADPPAPSVPAAGSPPPVAAPASSEAEPDASSAGDVPAETAAERKSRLAALKARLHERMGAEADPPAAEPAPPPLGPMIGLRQPPCLEARGISISGWVEQGITFNGDHPESGFNGPVDTNDLASEYQLNQLWMTMERPVNTGGAGFDFGGRIDVAYGTDWRWYMNNGLTNRLNGPDGQTYGMMLPQAYAAVGYDDLTVKLGSFQAILDYESLPAPANFLNSHSYCYTYGVPHLGTGVLADYQMDQNWSVEGGFQRGWSQYVNDNQALDFLGGFRWHSSDRRMVVSYTLSAGPQDVSVAENGFVYSLVVQEKLGARSEYVLVHDLGVQNNALPGGGAADWYGLNQYYIYTLSSQWAGCLRAEWFRDQDGVAVVGPGNVPGVRAWAGHGFAGNFYELTAGLNWRPQANVIFRPEVRYDWYDGGAGSYGASGQSGLPFNDGRSSTQFLTAADLILMF